MAVSPAQLSKLGVPVWKQIIAGGLYTGLAPIASGTVASAVAVLVYFTPWGANYLFLLGISLAAFIVGIPLARDVERALGHDPSFVTIDEFAGQWLALASPWVLHDPIWAGLTFFVFRVFDIAKLWPSSYFDQRPGGLGVMADDMFAGLYANIVCHLLIFGYQIVRQFV
ncbi:MAG TPA: phosphatidylglycerophosphatase A [Candidatus Kapabacteria bacterium]|nr:phosphatidylglycerophosphatase A [Candidatus Kapabacteria bacterium]